MKFHHTSSEVNIGIILSAWCFMVVFQKVCLRGVCLRSDRAKLIENIVNHTNIGNFVRLPNEEMGSVEEQPISNIVSQSKF